ncbi:MAG TPA: hypothetical protein VJN96_09255 [Vicinamibacterales bacterium]|nr:hypothetical protein [Vicinamibacterales bacterium]
MSGNTDTGSQPHFVIFLPFLRLNSACSVAGVEFVPLRDGDDNVPSTLSAAVAPLEKILSGYTDRHAEPFTNCVVATIPGRGWDLTIADGPAVNWAASLLFLACWSANRYFESGTRRYVNSSAFRIVGQSYSGALPDHIAVSARRRDGGWLDGGYEHGAFKFSTPLQCSVRTPATIDESFLCGLEAAQTAGSPTIGLLESALRFVGLANTDDDLMAENAEAILMGSAFDQLLLAGRKSSAYNLGRAFGALFGQFGTATVSEAMKARPNIEIDQKYASVQPSWWVHRKWIEELYDARSQVVHKGHQGARKWGWGLNEHLVMAAHVFPLTVKLLLARAGHYTLSDDDCVAGRVVDKLLICTGWDDGPDEGEASVWSTVISDVWLTQKVEKSLEKYKKEHPDLSGEPNDGSSSAS